MNSADPASADPLLRDGYVYRMVLQHEAQHQETMLQVLDMPEDGWGWNRALPYRREMGDDGDVSFGHGGQITAEEEMERVRITAGPFLMGTIDRTRAYDNERPRYEVDLGEFDIERYPNKHLAFSKGIHTCAGNALGRLEAQVAIDV